MVRGGSLSSESEEERHDRFRSERNQENRGVGLKLGCRLTTRDDNDSRKKHREDGRGSSTHSRRHDHRERRRQRRSESHSPCKRRDTPSPRVKKYEYAYSDTYHYREDRRSRSHTRQVKCVIKEDLKDDPSQRSRKHKREKHRSHKKRRKERHERDKRLPSDEDHESKRSRSPSSHESKTPHLANASPLRPTKPNKPLVEPAASRSPSLELDDVSADEGDDHLGMGPALPPTMRTEDAGGQIERENPEGGKITCTPAEPPNPQLDVVETVSIVVEDIESGDRVSENEESAEEGEIVSDGEKEKPLIGPKLPKRTHRPVLEKDENNLYGPALPPTLSADVLPTHEEADLSIGPLPENMANSGQRALEARAAFLRSQLESKGEEVSQEVRREEWMLELPQGRAQALGLGPRKFRPTEGPDLSDTSMWTDTPADKMKKAMLSKAGIVNNATSANDDMRKAWVEERDKAMEALAIEGSKGKKRDRSLLEIHQKEMKKKKKKEKKEKEGEKVERRPFSRETDLQVNRFDEAQKKSILKKAQLLNTRFSSGESKFL